MKIKRRLRYNRKRTFTFIFLFLIVLGITLGYAFLTTSLNVNGALEVSSSSWDIHFANIIEDQNGVEATTSPTVSNNTTITFAVDLEKATDFYSFTADIINDGTYDAKIDSITITPTLTTEQQEYFKYEVTYSDGTQIQANDALDSGTSETIKVYLEYKENADTSLYPEEDEELEFSVTITYVQGKGTEVIHPILYNVLENEAEAGTYAKEYTGAHQDSMAGVGSKKIYYWYTSIYANTTTIQDKWNVIFGGFCWQMIRTTDTGGVKMIYNGVPSNGECNNTGDAQQIGTSAFNTNYNSPAYVGYMYNPSTLITYTANSAATSGSLFGTGVTYSGGNYTLTNTTTTYDSTHHYTCNNTTGTCSTVRYYYCNNYYTEISDGRSIEEALEDMLSSDDVNTTDSTIKSIIDAWYQNNMTSYTSKLEDTIFCNDRSITRLKGWNPNGGSTTGFLEFKNYNINSDLSCTNETDKFSLANAKAQLTYPVGLITSSEMYLLNNNQLLRTGQDYWLVSPSYFREYVAIGRDVVTAGDMGYGYVSDSLGVRPAVSLATGTLYTSGDGSMTNPYIVE